MSRYLIQNAHDGKGSFVIVIEGRCGVRAGPFPDHYQARRHLKKLQAEAS